MKIVRGEEYSRKGAYFTKGPACEYHGRVGGRKGDTQKRTGD